MNRSKIIQMLILLTAITLIAGSFLRIAQRNSMSLAEYERLNAANSADSDASGDPQGGIAPEAPGNSDDLKDASGDPQDGTAPDTPGNSDDLKDASGDPQGGIAPDTPGNPDDLNDASGDPQGGTAPDTPGDPDASPLTGASLNGNSQSDSRIIYQEGFYYEPISDSLRRYITGVSFPAPDNTGSAPAPEIAVDELRYVHILHWDFNGEQAEGELICNEYIAQDLVEIFHELYRSEYQLEKVLLIDEYEGDDDASMADNNTSCFNYRTLENETRLSRHAYGLAVDVNPLYNPYITYEADGSEHISPTSAAPYADRSAAFPYKIDESDLCYRLFTEHGFTWGGNWNNAKDYQHFQKTKP